MLWRPSTEDTIPGANNSAAPAGRLLAEVITFESGETDGGHIGPFRGQQAGHAFHPPLPGDVVGRLSHDRAGVEGRAPFDENPGRIGPAVPGGVVERRPPEPVGPGRVESLIEERSDDLGGPAGRRRGEKRSLGGVGGPQVPAALGQAPEERRQAVRGGLRQQVPPFFPPGRNPSPFFEKKVDELALSAPGGETERGVAEPCRRR